MCEAKEFDFAALLGSDKERRRTGLEIVRRGEPWRAVGADSHRIRRLIGTARQKLALEMRLNVHDLLRARDAFEQFSVLRFILAREPQVSIRVGSEVSVGCEIFGKWFERDRMIVRKVREHRRDAETNNP